MARSTFAATSLALQVALIFCFECKEPFCFPGYDKLHQKGRRADHVHFRTRPCNCYVDEVRSRVCLRRLR